MNKQQFQHMRSEYRFRCKQAVRQSSQQAFSRIQDDYPLAVKCLPSDRPVSIRVWLKLDDIRRCTGETA